MWKRIGYRVAQLTAKQDLADSGISIAANTLQEAKRPARSVRRSRNAVLCVSSSLGRKNCTMRVPTVNSEVTAAPCSSGLRSREHAPIVSGNYDRSMLCDLRLHRPRSGR
jgi:hypothetical protein